MNRTRMTMMGLALALVATVAMAATINFSWQNATQNEDGSAIAATGPDALRDTVVEYGPCNAGRTALASVTGTIVTPAPGTASVADQLPSGTWCARARHTNNSSVASAWTSVGSVVKDPPTPRPPSNFSFD
jgi:hypothetical protein